MAGAAIFLDRDGVLNRAVVRHGKPYPPANLDELEVLPGVLSGLQMLKQAGFLLIGVTNQPDVAKGTQKREVVEAINAVLLANLPLDEILVCYHDDSANCVCRKPRPGMLLHAATKYTIDLSASFMIGDRWRDIEAGRRSGCTTLFLDYHYNEAEPHAPDYRVASLYEAAQLIVQLETNKTRSMRKIMKSLSELKVKIFADGANLAEMLEMYTNPFIKGFTTNPTLMRKAGINDYRAFAQEVIKAIPDRPISFEVFADDFDEMKRQAEEIASWGRKVYVKIPVTNTRAEPSYELIQELARKEIRLNVTALMTQEQVRQVGRSLAEGPPSFISVFAGRIADTGRDPVPLMAEAVDLLRPLPNCELIWASPRELLNIFQADAIGCHIITATNDILKKLNLVGKDLQEYSLDTVKMFYNDAQQSNYSL